MTHVTLHEGESTESLITRFRSGVQRSGILREVKRRRFFRTKSEKVREATQRAIRRARRKQRRF
ncbi:30S ribosomal protein S21 [SAR202 cluster bacterium AC-409-J13_OGT_754m]|nr:30S ribosomal protein S21 [SAR202 cluster bacterium AC-409-J13_OGT_754m]